MSVSIAHRTAGLVRMRDAATRVRELLESVEFLPQFSHDGETPRRELLISFSELIEPRLSDATRPLLVVVAGSTGAGKSTIVNSVLGSDVTEAGIFRPTTRRPVLLHHPDDDDPIGPDMKSEVDVHATTEMPRGLALIDSPDIDSVLEENRERALKVLSGADLWLFVTTPTRYGDAVPWEVLAEAAQRDVAIAVVLNRTDSDARKAVRLDLANRLRDSELGTAPLFVVEDAGAHQGVLDPSFVAGLKRWLTALAAGSYAQVVARRSLRGALSAVIEPLEDLVMVLKKQDDRLFALAAACETHEQVIRSRSEQPWGELGDSDEVLRLWHENAHVWELLSEERPPRIRRRDRQTMRLVLEELDRQWAKELNALPKRQFTNLAAAIGEEVANVGLREAWEETTKLPPTIPEAPFENWYYDAADVAVTLQKHAADKTTRRVIRTVGVEAVAALLTLAASNVQRAEKVTEDLLAAEGKQAIIELREKLVTIQNRLTDHIVDDVRHQLVGLLPMRKSGEQLHYATQRLQEA